jgi:hypothetical protein
MKICPVGAELFHTDGQTDRHVIKLIVAFRDPAIAPKNGFQLLLNPQEGIG